MKKISVIIPVYNSMPYIEKCIESVRRSTYENLEIIIVNDGSTDGSDKVCDAYAKRDKRVRVFHQPNKGVVNAKKTGIRHATGELIAWIDSDDWMEENYIAQLYQAYEQSKADIVAADIFFDIGAESKIVKNGIACGVYEVKEILPYMLYNRTFFEYGIQPHLVTKLMKRKLVEEIQQTLDDEINSGEDAAVLYPYILMSHSICVIDICGYHYVQHPGSMTGTVRKDEVRRLRSLFLQLKKYMYIGEYAKIFRTQLIQYEKYQLLLRLFSYTDDERSREVLKAYGGISRDSRVVLYGAGGLGKKIFFYLHKDCEMNIVAWLDKNDKFYKKQGLSVCHPDMFDFTNSEYDHIIIANTSQTVSESIKKSLTKYGVPPDKIKWLEEKWLCTEYTCGIFIE